MKFDFVIDDFEGPLDLLLHLVKENKMDLLNIKLEVIIDEYLEFINKMEEMNLNIASSYLVMASELIELKSKKILPRNEEEDITEEDEISEEKLINRLIEYQRYKDLTNDFKQLEEERKEIFTSLPKNLKEYSDDIGVIPNSDISLIDLVEAFKKFLERKELEKPLTTKVTKKEISLEERARDVKRILKKKKRVNFFELFDVVTKEYVVATFLTILEMCRKKEIRLTQDDMFGEIMCEVCDGK
jgi:segregation and condensation protein A